MRFRLVPKYCSEEQFWSRYFATVARVKEQVKAEQMWGDFDMLSEDEGHPQGEPYTLFAYTHQKAVCHEKHHRQLNQTSLPAGPSPLSSSRALPGPFFSFVPAQQVGPCHLIVLCPRSQLYMSGVIHHVHTLLHLHLALTMAAQDSDLL